MAKRRSKIDFPIFSIHGNYLSEEIEQAVNLRNSIAELTEVVEEFNKHLVNTGTKLNIYINNTIKRDKPFNFIDNMIVFSGENEISIYSHDEVDEILDGQELCDLEEEELFDMLPPTNDKFKLNKKQSAKCAELVDEYNSIFDEYECFLYDLEECTHWYTYIIEGFKEELTEIKLFDLKKGETQINEPFNEDKHELLITRDIETNDWKLIYIRKEDKDKFMKIIEENKQEIDNGDCE